MKNADMPAMPQSATSNGYACNYGSATGLQIPTGLTKREMFAMHAMQGILANLASNCIGYTDWEKLLAENSVKAADSLLLELDE